MSQAQTSVSLEGKGTNVTRVTITITERDSNGENTLDLPQSPGLATAVDILTRGLTLDPEHLDIYVNVTSSHPDVRFYVAGDWVRVDAWDRDQLLSVVKSLRNRAHDQPNEPSGNSEFRAHFGDLTYNGRLMVNRSESQVFYIRLDSSSEQPTAPVFEAPLKRALAALIAQHEGDTAEFLREWDAYLQTSNATPRSLAYFLSSEQEEQRNRDYAANLIANEGAYRIRCGALGNLETGSERWHGDRFYIGGEPRDPPSSVTVRGTEKPILYLIRRTFPEAVGGYRIPLKNGGYSVSLHFVETFSENAGYRVFDVIIEGRTVLSAYEPRSAGFATADVKTIDDVQVNDGYLDISLKKIADMPTISGIEIRSLAN
jgi:hypothetical protein